MKSSAPAMENDSSVLELDELLPEANDLKTEKGEKSGAGHKKSNRFVGIGVGAGIVFITVLVGASFLLQQKGSEASYESLKISLSSDFVDRDSYLALQEKANELTAAISDLPEKMIALGNKMNEIQNDFDASKTQFMEFEAWTENSAKRLGDMEQRIEKLETINARKAISHKPKSEAPKFELDIDGLGVWNGVPFVSVEDQGSYIMMEVGQRINGWLLVSLDPVARLAEFEYKTGVKIKRKV